MGGRLLLVSGVALAVSALASGPAAADQIQPTSIGQIMVNGSAPASGSGLEASATLAGPTSSPSSMTLTVTNASSSYTDVKEVDGVGNYAGYPSIDSVTAGSHACSVSEGGGGSFSCPGLSLAPGQSVTITVSYPYDVISDGTGSGVYHGAGLASVNVLYDAVDVNGSPMNADGQGLQVKALFTQGNCPDFTSLSNGWCLNIVNSPSNGTQVSSVDVALNAPPAGGSAGQIQTIIPPIGGAYSPSSDPAGICGSEQDPALGSALYCQTYFGQSDFEMNFTDSSYTSGLGGVDVGFMSTPCANSANTVETDLESPVADATGGSCQRPSHTRIRAAKINTGRHTALFTFTANHATTFRCVLTRNSRVLFAHACQSPKDYSGKLPRGKYVFLVAGTNRAGVDTHPATKRFTLR